ncbi:transcription factor A, mitochondrial [Bombus terrestris]|uniref:Transcription factor A, mitochondrial n=1 Tax=Bombus terrestris TaxID=30195 RepID=A0A9B0F1M9_BOMTE|nr:transcription factor A, mitochondrial [Bombus terrestris]
MVYFRRFIFLMRSENLLCTRNCLLNLYQNSSRSALRQLKDTVLPPKPKRPEGPFFLYVKHIKLKFLEETPDISQVQLLKRASRQWAELDLAEKEYFMNQYHKNREIYMNELKEYNNSITNEQRELWEKKKKEYLQNNSSLSNKRKYEMLGRPKKSLNPFLCYVTSKKNDKNPNTSFKEWVKLLSTSWKELSGAEKESYINKATQLSIQYQKDLEKWEVEMIHSGHPDVVRPKILRKYKNIEDKNEK